MFKPHTRWIEKGKAGVSVEFRVPACVIEEWVLRNLPPHIPETFRALCKEFSGRHNVRELDATEQMALLAKGIAGKRLKYKELIS